MNFNAPEKYTPLANAEADARKADNVPDTPQTRAPAYKLAFRDRSEERRVGKEC